MSGRTAESGWHPRWLSRQATVHHMHVVRWPCKASVRGTQDAGIRLDALPLNPKPHAQEARPAAMPAG